MGRHQSTPIRFLNQHERILRDVYNQLKKPNMDLQLFRGQRGHGFYTVVLGGRAGRPDRVSQSPLYKKKYALRVIGPRMVTGTYEVVYDADDARHLRAAAFLGTLASSCLKIS